MGGSVISLLVLDDFRLKFCMWYSDSWLVHLEATREWFTDTNEVHLEHITEEAADLKRLRGCIPWKKCVISDGFSIDVTNVQLVTKHFYNASYVPCSRDNKHRFENMHAQEQPKLWISMLDYLNIKNCSWNFENIENLQ